MKDAIKKYLHEEILGGNAEVTVEDEDDLLLSGLVDSIGLMRLIAFLEEEFDVQVPPEEVTIDRFRSVATIAQYLEGRGRPDV
jgi:acyl carrier protein